MRRSIGVGVIGASPLRPGWAVTAHLPAIASLPEYSLRAVATRARIPRGHIAVPSLLTIANHKGHSYD
jgi:hypothetical protein